MNGGLMKTTSRLAVLAAAGLFAGAAQAADLGGNCCTDLEERIAELEATTVRKGNRNVSLQIYGHVNEMIMAWDDGVEKNVYVGTNDDSRSRFGFKGSAKINNDWTAGFVMEFGLRIARSDKWNQCSDADVAEVDDPCASGGAPTSEGDGLDPQFDVRRSAWYLDSKTYGRITVGRDSTIDSVGVNLANVNAPVYDDMNDDFGVRFSDGTFTGRRYDQLMPQWSYNAPRRTRQNMIKYDSPTFQGFTLSGAWGEDDYWSVALRYANEFNGIRVAAATAYSWLNEPDSEAGCTQNGGPNGSVDCEAWGIGGSVMHMATGLFVSGAYGEVKDNFRRADAPSDTDDWWYIMAGIERKWFSLGKTTIYGTYYEGTNNCGRVSGDACSFSQGSTNLTSGISSTTNEMWSIGVNQRIDAAAMDLYLAYYHWTPDIKDASGVSYDLEDMSAVISGAKIRF